MSRSMTWVLKGGVALAVIVAVVWVTYWYTASAIKTTAAFWFPKRMHREYLQTNVGVPLVRDADICECLEEPSTSRTSPTIWKITREGGGSVIDVDALSAQVVSRSNSSDFTRVAQVFGRSMPQELFDERTAYEYLKLAPATEVYLATVPAGKGRRSYAIIQWKSPDGAGR